MQTNQPQPAAFLRVAPNHREPFVLTCEHARSALPPGIVPSTAERAILRSHWGWDPGAWALTRQTARLLSTGATGGRWSRLWIDLNRPAGDPTLVRRCVEGQHLSWNVRLGATELDRRFTQLHSVYHAEVEREIALRVNRLIRPVLLAVHSYAPILNGTPRDFDAGVLYDAHQGEARTLARALRSAGLSVRYNEPYSGKEGLMYSIQRHGSHHGLPCLELEINQRLFGYAQAHLALARAVARGLVEIERKTRTRRGSTSG